MKINIVGDYFGQSGYSIHTKQLALALNKLVPVTITTNKHPNWQFGLSDEEFKMLSGIGDECDIHLLITTPTYWNLFTCKNKPVIGFLVWEGDKIPNSWINNLLHENIKQIWVPSEHTKQAILNTSNDKSISDKIRIVPHGVNLEIFKPIPEKKDPIFTFVANKGWRGGWLDRGGLAFLFKAFNEEFSKEDKVQLLVKINSVYAQINLQQEMDKLKLIQDRAPIKITPENLPFEVLPQFYNIGHVFVSPSMAEAYNMPCLEAMACGLPVITTNFGGQSDYVNDVNGWLLKEGTMFEVKHDIMYEGIQWLKPSIEELRRVLRYVYEHQDEVAFKGLVALQDSKKMTWDNTAQKALECLTI